MPDKSSELRFAGDCVPANAAQLKIQTASEAMRVLHRFNEAFPHLATTDTVRVVSEVRRRIDEIESTLAASR